MRQTFFWLEDAYRDGGVSIFGHRKLRELINTPLLQTEHVFGLEQHVDFIVNGGTDFVRTGTYEDGGITGAMKVAHAAEVLAWMWSSTAEAWRIGTVSPLSATPTIMNWGCCTR